MNVTDRVALVTHAGAGIGQAVARALAEAGAAVCVNDVNPDRVDQVVAALQASGGRAMPWTGDISNRFQVAAMIEATRDALGELSILVNAARVDKRAPFRLLDEYDWRRVIEINLTGAFFCTQLAGRVMADAGGGVIVHVTDGDFQPDPDRAAYAASQSGITGLVRAAARDLAEQGVRVNAVCPAPTETPADVAARVLFLCSDAAAHMTGQIVMV